MNIIPKEIWKEIFSFLSIKSMEQINITCKMFHKIISTFIIPKEKLMNEIYKNEEISTLSVKEAINLLKLYPMTRYIIIFKSHKDSIDNYKLFYKFNIGHIIITENSVIKNYLILFILIKIWK